MLPPSFFTQIEAIVRQELSCSAHDMLHVERVYKTACLLAANEDGADMDVIKAAALLHDIARAKEDADPTGQSDHARIGADMTEAILNKLGADAAFTQKVKNAILRHRYKGTDAPQTLEDKILFDADKIDVLGAAGLVRSFMIAGTHGQPPYKNVDLDAYVHDNLVGGTRTGRVKDIRKHAPNIEFELKMKHLPARMFTAAGKKLAAERLAFMQDFFDRLAQECA